jgi:hypothetical protein
MVGKHMLVKNLPKLSIAEVVGKDYNQITWP